ncbi:hypothetical protein P6144_00190 [Sphingomonas sp. HITSZ_GF]|uniref:hypothetical protein n=1 Tax=Sphingomonas sp. HITSZ_GF TaxID=3037247 RepID=UPI00240E63E4|nr:hypothetical protein [Sphingomonas sp. HITSZ_GF]MDG2532054.1 hypothetical protein [Sphingomonas sp. HITSZ_GF]
MPDFKRFRSARIALHIPHTTKSILRFMKRNRVRLEGGWAYFRDPIISANFSMMFGAYVDQIEERLSNNTAQKTGL